GWQLPGRRVGYKKVAVIGAIARKGNVVAKVIGAMGAESKADFVRQAVSENVSLVATDEDPGFKYVRKDLPHENIHHGRGEDARGRRRAPRRVKALRPKAVR